MTLRILIVDDSSFVRLALKRVLSAERGLQVVAEAATGQAALSVLAEREIDVVTLDVQLPDMSGLSVLREIVDHHPKTQVLMLSALTQDGAQVTVEALTLGAADFVDKTQFGALDLVQFGGEMLDKLRAIKQTRARRSFARPPMVAKVPRQARSFELCVLGASTGGPQLVQNILQAMSPKATFPIVVAQHMPAGFTAAFAARLDTVCRVTVQEARDGMALKPGHAYIAPGSLQTRVRRGMVLSVSASSGTERHAPSVDVLFESAAEAVHDNCLAILLTGMGRDGATGMATIRKRGGHTIAQDEASSVVYGMPRAAVELRAALEQLSAQEIEGYVAKLGEG